MILDWLEEWFKGVLIDGITSNLTGLFDTVNGKVGEIAADVGATPQDWNSGVFNMLRSLSETVIVPIAGAILALIMCYELIQLIAERNNMHDMDSWMLFRWVFKSAAAIILVSNTWNIVMGVFDLTQSVVNQSAGVIIGNTSIDITAVVTDLENRLSDMDIGGLLGLWFQSLFVGLTMNILSICIMLVVYGRLISRDLAGAYPPRHHRQQRVAGHGAGLLEIPVRPGLPSVPDNGGDGHLRRPGAEHRPLRRRFRGDMGLYGLYGAAVLLPVQDREHRQGRIRRPLKEA